MKAILATASVAALVAGTPLAAAPAPVAVHIDTARRATPVSAHEYGMFIEPIGGLVNRTLWAELLDDRKFYYPVVVAIARHAATAQRGGQARRRISQNGARSALTMP